MRGSTTCGIGTERKIMDAESLLCTATNSDAWLSKSVSLRRSADVLWDAFVLRIIQHARVYDKKAKKGDETGLKEAYQHLTVAKMLYGCAVETALKAYLLRSNPSSTEIHLRADGTGKIYEAHLKQLGVSLGKSHNLILLAEQAGAFAGSEGGVFTLESDINTLRAILEDLSDAITWYGRYPVPLRSGTAFIPAPGVPRVAYGHYLRDWLDPFLNHYHGETFVLSQE